MLCSLNTAIPFSRRTNADSFKQIVPSSESCELYNAASPAVFAKCKDVICANEPFLYCRNQPVSVIFAQRGDIQPRHCRDIETSVCWVGEFASRVCTAAVVLVSEGLSYSSSQSEDDNLPVIRDEVAFAVADEPAILNQRHIVDLHHAIRGRSNHGKHW